ncbi:motility associated factor glycosyltransferase family protein [Clostridium botulinum]|nr:motility associated factor glycosyltransferase family protein [Clostridium botulinum]
MRNKENFMLKENSISLKKYYYELYEQIIDLKAEKSVKYIMSKNYMNNLVFENKFYIHSRYNPGKEAINWVNNIRIKDEDTVIIVGLGLGYYLDYLCEVIKDKKIIIIEPYLEVFDKLLNFKDISKFLASENIVFMVNISPYVIRSLISEYLLENKIKKFLVCELSIYKKIDEEYFKELYKEIARALSEIKCNIATEYSFSQMWLNNTIRLLDYIKKIPNINNFRGHFDNIPAVIVSAGPSLEKNMHYLKQIYNKSLIIAVGSAVNILEKNNISPHIIMGVDGQEMEAKIFKELKNTKPVLIFAPTIHHKAVENYKGLKACLTLNDDVSMVKLYKKIGLDVTCINCGPSISNIALDFAYYLKTSPILLIGQDLAYTNDNRYADGGIHNEIVSKKINNKSNKYKKVVDIDGNEVYTKYDLIGIKDWFEDYISVFKDKIEIYNCTEGGIEIKGIPNLKFEHAINKFCCDEVDIEEKLKLLCIKKVNEDKECILENLIDKYKEEVNTLIKLSNKRLKEVYKAIDNYNENNFHKELKFILKLCDKIESYESFDIFIKPTGTRYINSITSSINNKIDAIENINEKNKVILEGLKLQYEYIDKCIYIMKMAFDKKDIKYTS